MSTILMHARSMDAIRPRSNDERRGEWAQRYFGAGYHNNPAKPRVRLPYPDVEMTQEPVADCPAPDQF